MDYICVGKIVNTHGIKGELRIISDFELKEQIFKPGFKLYIGDSYLEEEVNSYRVHKEYDMVTFKGYNNINQVLKYLKMKVYVKREDLEIKEYLMTDLIGLDVYLGVEKVGKVRDFVYNGSNKLLDICGEKCFYVPFVDDFVEEINLKDKKILVTDNIRGLMR